MGEQKIPDKSNFLEKFAAVESLLQKRTQPEIEPDYSNYKESEQAINSQYITSEIPVIEQDLKCNKCGAARNPEDVFCGTCGNKLQDN